MMISPGSYIDNLKGASYMKLIKERNSLIRSVQGFERKEKAGNRAEEDWEICPSPEVVYQTKLEYLSKLCAFMAEKYNDDYVWGDKKLCGK